MQYMDAIVKPVAGPGLELRKVPVPVPGPGEVLIKVHKTAICGTDVHIYNWDPWAQEHIKAPMTIGHEYVGEVAALGAGVTGLKIGQRVSGEGHLTCHHCRNCHNGDIQWCKDTQGVGVDRDGAFAEYVCIPETNVIMIDESLPEDVVAFFDAFGNATHTALMFPLIGEDVLITGAGPIGIIAAGVCKFAGARRVIITDVNDYRLELARKMGVDAAVNTAKEDLTEVMKAKGLVEGFYKPEENYRFDHSHAWGGTPAYALPLALSGLEILEPGFRAIRLNPSLLGLAWARVQIPTPYGIIELRMVEGERPAVSVPEGITLES